MYNNHSKILWRSNDQEMRFKIQWFGKREMINWCGRREKRKERMGHWGHIRVSFLTHPIPLKSSQWDDFNHTLKDHQTKSWLVRGFVWA